MAAKQAATEVAGDWVALLLVGMGITFNAYEYFGGLFFAAAAAMLTRHWFPEKDRREVWLTLLSAFFVSTIGVEIYDWYFDPKPLPYQLTMAALGLCSRVIVTLAMTLLLRTEARAPEIANRVIDAKLPEERK